jgi:hypothetical protein
MKKSERKLQANGSGQLLIVAALAIAILISSTTMYVYELSRETNSEDYSSIGNFILAIKQGTRNAMISSLANVSNGGEKNVLAANLNSLSEVFRKIDSLGICQLDYTLLNDSDYERGRMLSWNNSGIGVSGAYANFTLKVYGMATNVTLTYPVNVTSTVAITGGYARLIGDEKLVNLTCNVYNGEAPALARNISFYYQELGTWLPVDSSNDLSIIDYGNGMYHIVFVASSSLSAVQVRVQIYDLRGIFVQADTTCYET